MKVSCMASGATTRYFSSVIDVDIDASSFVTGFNESKTLMYPSFCAMWRGVWPVWRKKEFESELRSASWRTYAGDSIRIGLMFNQSVNDVQVSLLSGLMQRRVSNASGGVGLCSLLDQIANHVSLTEVSCNVERSVTGFCWSFNVGSMLDENLSDLNFVFLSAQMQWS